MYKCSFSVSGTDDYLLDSLRDTGDPALSFILIYILLDTRETMISTVPMRSNTVTAFPWMIETTSVVTGTKFMNSSPFNGDRMLTPMFQPSSAMTPGNIIINNKCGAVAFKSAAVGTSTAPNIEAPAVMIIAVTVPSKQLNVE